MRNFFVRKSFWQLLSSYMYIVKAAETTFVRKICMFNVDEILRQEVKDELKIMHTRLMLSVGIRLE